MTKPIVLLDWADEVLDARALAALEDIVRWARHEEKLRLLFDGPGARFAAALVAQACGKALEAIDAKRRRRSAGAILLIDASRNRSDRAANQQIAYLLQRVEDYPGVVIVAANLRAPVDDAFARRFQAAIRFTAPSPAKPVRRSAPSKKRPRRRKASRRRSGIIGT